MTSILVSAEHLDADTTVTTVESAYKKFLSNETTYTVAVYSVNPDALADYDKDLETIRGLSKSKAKAVAGDGVMDFQATATIVRNNRRSRQSLAFDCSCIYLQFVSATPKPSSIRFPSFPLSLTGNFSVKILLMYFLFPSVFYIIVYPNNNRFIRICKVARS